MSRCPHCKVDTPSLIKKWTYKTRDFAGSNQRTWVVYECSRCGGLITAGSNDILGEVTELYPSSKDVNPEIPEKARNYLSQALNSLHSPAGAVMLSASSVDAMLKAKGYTEGSLNTRINDAAKDNLITKEMATWAHQVRLDANDQRHADEEAELPTENEAKKTMEFTTALGDFLFTLPAMVSRGIKESKTNPK